jgi:hypothetical protein
MVVWRKLKRSLQADVVSITYKFMIAEEYPDEDPELARIDAILDQVRAILGEHFEIGIVLLSNVGENGITSYHSTQFGNKFALNGMVDAYRDGMFDYDDEED